MDIQIKAEFESNGFSFKKEEEDQILQQYLNICINYSLSPTDLVSNWEVYYLNRQLDGLVIESSYMDGFMSYIQNEVKDKFNKEEPHLHIYSSTDIEMLAVDELDNSRENLFDTPIRTHERPLMVASTPKTNGKSTSKEDSKIVNNCITPFGQRLKKFVSQITLNGVSEIGTMTSQDVDGTEDDDIIKRVRPREKCSLHVYSTQPKQNCRFMYDRVENRFNFLENRIKKHISAHTSLGLHGEITDATLASQNNIFSIGMVCCDGEGRLNEKSAILQGSVENSGGHRVRLDLQKVSPFSLFPGQVIGVEGNNPSGHCFIASKVIDSLPYEVTSLPPAKRQAIDYQDNTESSATSKVLSMVIAAGPFTTTDNLLFEPLAELLAYASRKQPQLLILLGPFVDSEHPMIKKGAVDRTFSEIFYDEITKRLLDYADFMGSSARAILVPSIRDANHDFVFPQPAFDIQLPEGTEDQITLLTNPACFGANEVTVGCSTVDILKHLSSEEISRTSANAPSGERIGRLATHLLNQHSYYPLYPPSDSVPLDTSLAPEALEISTIPDILLLPSDLTPFVKVLNFAEENEEKATKFICINPGRIAKGIGGGTFVEVNYNGNAENTNAYTIRI